MNDRRISVTWETKDLGVFSRFLTIEEQQQFLKEAEGSWYEEMFYVMFLTGMRIGEVGALDWDRDVDFKNKCFWINCSLHCSYYEGVKTIVLNTPKTPNSKRKIPFMGECEEMMLRQREAK